MKLKTLIVILITLIQPLIGKTYLKLQPGTKLTKGDQLISTLGLFKLIMNDNDCSLNYYKFDKKSQNYTSMNKSYHGKINASCTYLSIVNNRILTHNSTVFLQLTSSNLSQVYLIIDDYAIIRFIGLKNTAGNIGPSDYDQIQYTNNSQPNSFLSLLDSYNQISDKMQSTSNSNNWMFQISNQVLTITNPIYQIQQNFNLPQLYFTINGAYNSNNQTFPGTNFIDDFFYGTVCSAQKSKLYGPFVIEIHQYLPRVTIYDQEKYIVFQYSIIKSQYNSNFCPRFTFNLNDKCYTSCPTPYLQQIKGQRGTCVLNCQYGAIMDNKLKICICQNKVNFVAPNYNCINSTSYYFGCFCQNNTYFDRNTYTCQLNCSNSTQPYLGLCLSCEKGCSQCSISFNGLYYLICTKCLIGFTLNNGICSSVSTCTSNCLQCSNSVCIICQPFFVLDNGICKQTCGKGQPLTIPNLTSICTSQPITNKCSIDCLKCSSDSTCQICQPGYALLVSPISISCRKKNLLYTCKSKIYSSSPNSNVCYSNDSTSLSKLTKCMGSISNCLICHSKLSNVCLLCKQGYFLQQNQCVRQCLSTYVKVNQGCIKKISLCEINSFQKGTSPSVITTQKIKSSQYLNFINNGLQLTNQPYGFSLYFMNLFTFKNDITSSNSNIGWIKQACSQCQKGYGLTADKSTCVPCPQGCLLCLFANSCLATTTQQTNALTSTFSGCLSFIFGQACAQSCPKNTYPAFNQSLQKMYCSRQQQSPTQGYVKIDGSTYPISQNKYIHRFVFDTIITLKKVRLLQQNNLTIDASGNSITFQNDRPTQILNITGNLLNLVASNGQYPSNSVYGINQQTSFRLYIKKWLAGIGYVLSILIIIVHCIYIANSILYKMDNIIIFVQSIYFFLFNRILISNPLAQFYYGFSWAHLNFFPNYFEPELNLSQPTIPPYALYNLDANVIRNAGSSLSLILTFTLIWSTVSLVIYLLDSKYGRKQVWYFKIFKNSIIGVIQLLSYNIFYWCIAFINYDKNYVNSGTFIGLSVLLLTILIIYIIGRLYVNLIAGIYMVKRLIYACILASSYENVGYVGIIIFIEALFGVARSIIQKPRQKWMLISLWVEQGFIIIFLIILYVTVNASVVSILTTIFVYCWLLTFVADISDIYFLSKNKYLEISCFKKFFQQEAFRSTQSKQQTDRQISLNKQQQK